jgi:lipopolysaccharide transport system permease protein
VPFLILILGLMWLLSAIGVYYRDTGNTVALIIPALMFMSPIFYPLSAVPQEYRFLMTANPLTFYVEQTRRLIIGGLPLQYGELLIQFGISVAVAAIGYWFFQRTRKGFADVL